MRAANRGTLNITPLAPNTDPIPKNTGPLSDPQTDFFLNALGLNHIWTVPSDTVLNSRDVVPEVEFCMDRNKDLFVDPNQLSISDDEADEIDIVHCKKTNPIDENEIDLDENDDDDNGENENDDDDVWEAASISASQVSFNASNVHTHVHTHTLDLPKAEAVNELKKANFNLGVISFDDDVQLVPNKCDLTTFSNLKDSVEHSGAMFDRESSS